MEITKETFKQWQSLKERGDVTKIAYMYSLRVPTVSVAINSGIMPMKYYVAISKFYNKRLKYIK